MLKKRGETQEWLKSTHMRRGGKVKEGLRGKTRERMKGRKRIEKPRGEKKNLGNPKGETPRRKDPVN